MGDPKLFYTGRVDGLFASVTTRRVPRQDKPYPPLVEVAKAQPIFHLADVAGTLAGVRCEPENYSTLCYVDNGMR
jgi:acetolactate decarboxylase